MTATTPVSCQTNLVLSPEDGTSRYSAEYQPRIAGLPDGSFVALWNDFLPQTAGAAPAGYPYAIDADGGVAMMIRVFGADGVARGPARPVSADFDGAGLVTLGNGLVAAGWGVTDVPGGASRIGAPVLDPATGSTMGGEVPVATGALFSEGVTFHQIVALSGGRAGVIWTAPAAPTGCACRCWRRTAARAPPRPCSAPVPPGWPASACATR